MTAVVLRERIGSMKKAKYLELCFKYLDKIEFFIEEDFRSEMRDKLNEFTHEKLVKMFLLLRCIWMEEQTVFMKFGQRSDEVKGTFKEFMSSGEKKLIVEETKKKLKEMMS